MTQKADTARLDIIMPVYNTADYLDQCLQSIVGQTLTDWHLIIVDDGSTDGSPQICDRWAEKDSRITVVHKENTGQADSRNIALDMCRAPYVGGSGVRVRVRVNRMKNEELSASPIKKTTI